MTAGGAPEKANLARAVAALYDVFVVHPLRPDTEPCLHCHTPEEERVLHRALLRDLSKEDIAGYAADAMKTWGNEADFKHFLPRIFEIVATDDFSWPDIEVVYATLRHAGWRGWRDQEQRAVEAYLLAKWQLTLSEYPAVHDVEDVLCAIAQAVDDLLPFLAAWPRVAGEAPVRHLSELLWDNAASLIQGPRLGNAFWSAEQRPQQEQFRRWLREDAVLAWVERAFFGASSDAVAERISTAASVLEAIRR